MMYTPIQLSRGPERIYLTIRGKAGVIRHESGISIIDVPSGEWPYPWYMAFCVPFCSGRVYKSLEEA